MTNTDAYYRTYTIEELAHIDAQMSQHAMALETFEKAAAVAKELGPFADDGCHGYLARTIQKMLLEQILVAAAVSRAEDAFAHEYLASVYDGQLTRHAIRVVGFIVKAAEEVDAAPALRRYAPLLTEYRSAAS